MHHESETERLNCQDQTTETAAHSAAVSQAWFTLHLIVGMQRRFSHAEKKQSVFLVVLQACKIFDTLVNTPPWAIPNS